MIEDKATSGGGGPDGAQDLIKKGMDAARREDYETGMACLEEAYGLLPKDKDAKIPAAFLSYYGVCIALHAGRLKEGMDFCQVALEREFYNAELYLNLAKVCLAAKARRRAVEILERGLAVEPRSSGLLKLRSSMGVRKSPTVPFLSRDNPINVSLGRARHSMGTGKKSGKASGARSSSKPSTRPPRGKS